MKDPNAEAPKVQIVDLMGALKRSLDQHPNAKPAPAPEPKLCHAGCKLNDLGVHVPDCDNRPNHTPEPKQGSEEPIEPVTELEAVKHTNKILRAQLAKAWAETDEARATKDMHKERQEEAWAEVAALRAELTQAEKACALALDYVQGSPRPRHMDVVSALREVIARAKEGEKR